MYKQWGLLITSCMLASSCTYNTRVVEYSQVSVAPPIAYDVVTTAPIVSTTSYYSVAQPLDVTRTVIDYY